MNTATYPTAASDSALVPLVSPEALTPQAKCRLVRRALAASDDWVIEMQYADSKGVRTKRTVSPIRFLAADRFLALCLCRQEPRQFYLDRCSDIRLQAAADVLMPVPMG